jgi:tetratricopeptide (TPR) repeat protein
MNFSPSAYRRTISGFADPKLVTTRPHSPTNNEEPGAWMDLDPDPASQSAPSTLSGRTIDIRNRISLCAGASEAQLVDWLCADQIRRWRSGQRIPAEAYLALHPTFQSAGEPAFEVVYNEFMLRESIGESPTLVEFLWRFPKLEPLLRRQLSFHRVLANDDKTKPDDPPPDRNENDGPQADGYPEIPGHRILSELGRGGAGVVYKACQLALNRLVALKVIQTGQYAMQGSVGRFRAEAEAVARFQHPNIIQIYEVGEYEGLGYLSLEYASGGSLETSIAGTPRDPREAASLVESLASAIHYAHECGIVHRDLKPANVVMTAAGMPKITDFGLAKLLEQEDGMTVSGMILGTPSYMAPEQLLGLSHEITPAADVYALGAILYEILTGRPPFKGATPLSTLDQVANQEPLVPSKLQRNTPPDVETICMKCLEKDPARRYATARALADDLRRFLDGRPILARPTPLWEKAAKAARRRPGLAAATGAVVVAICVGFVGVLYYNGLLREGVKTARVAQSQAVRNARSAIEQRNLALKALDKLVFEVQERLGESPATRSLRRSLLDTAIAGLDELAQSTETTPPDLSRAVAHQKLGEIYRQVGRSAEATRQLEQSVRLAEQLAQAAPEDVAVKDCLSRAHIGLGELDLRASRIEPALRHFHQVVDLSEQIAAIEPGWPGALRGLIEAYVRVGRAHGFHKEYVPALSWFQKAGALSDRWLHDEPESAEAAAMLAWSYRKAADIGKLSGSPDLGIADYQRAIHVGRESLKLHPTDVPTLLHLATALNDLAGVLHGRHDLQGAIPPYAEAEVLLAGLAEADPENVETRFMLSHAQYDHARVQKDLGRFADAATAYRRAIASLRKFPAERQPMFASVEFMQLDVLERALAECERAGRR